MNSLLFALSLVCCTADSEAWVPPENPVPRIILKEARADAREGRHQVALAKHVWYHKHATEHDESAKHTRLLLALHYWIELGEMYPPALRTQMRIADQDQKFGEQRRRVAEVILSRDASMLVACLVIAGRDAEAKRTAEVLKEQCDSPRYHESLEKALKGTVPGPLVPNAKPKD